MLSDILRGAGCHHQATGFATFRPQVNEPISRAHHVQVVFNDDDRMPGIEQPAQCTHQFGNVVKVQAGGRLVK